MSSSDLASTSLAERLAHAQSRAAQLFRALEEEHVIVAGQTEQGVSDATHALAANRFGVQKHWHRRVVRSGPHTRLPFRELPPDRIIEDDDIVSLDLGPVFGSYEADFGRTFVIGNDSEKLRLRDDLALLFKLGRDFYSDRPAMTGQELYAFVVSACSARGWGFGGAHAGHLVGSHPFAREARDAARNRIRPDNDFAMNAPDDEGEPRHWILEIHLLDPSGAFGGFYEELLV